MTLAPNFRFLLTALYALTLYDALATVARWVRMGSARFAINFTNISNSLKIMARPKGFEPLTPRFVVWCSIQLSYGRP
jgi:hypothetical protein